MFKKPNPLVRLICAGLFCFGGLIGASFLLSGCEVSTNDNRFIVEQWHKQDLEAHLARWLAVAPTPSGLMLGSFDRRWQAVPTQGGDLTTHSRLIFTMVKGYEHSGDKRYLEVAVRGAEFLLDRFHDPQYGGFFSRVEGDGKVVNAGKNTYGHAFALLALAHVARVTKDEKFRAAALSAWGDINSHLRDSSGGFRPDAPRDFGPSSSLRNQNPVMHMFEALLALIDATGDPRALAGAQSVGNFVLYKLLEGQPDGGACIPEWYDEHWKALPTKDKGGYIDLGHQFEWSHLLATSESRGLPALYGAAADRLLSYGIKLGYDDIEGGVFNRLYPDGSIDRNKYWWQQAEGLHALLVAASRSQRRDLWRRYEQTLELVKEQFIDEMNGGWKLAAKRTCESGRCGAEQPEPYHMVAMHSAALELSKPLR
ncbi:AGE family epimerase/isomerase [Dechloromonas denitrificans]|uniref:AGE family epimerase/isomerase n=1 Tax=Dechloromonas denitrificans TaxID=281362 RepID=UPI001CF86470|nr:AGE family epimerase/isomerase [Dechloromonas denitrificans]UCV05037.1 AGE family epimerase/isomerase [Dechloromonas denitrificans]